MNNHYFLLRHGQTPYQAENKSTLYPSPENPPVEITEKGKEQIKEAAQSLKTKNINLIFSSDFYRTRQTAEIVAKELGLEVHFDKRLIDLNIGIFQGGPRENYKKFFLEKKERFNKRPPQGESWNDVRERLADLLNEIEGRYQDKNILLISHGDPLWLLAGIIKGLKTEEEFMEIRYTKFYPKVGELIEMQ